MARFVKDRSKAKGLAPGALVFIGNKKLDQAKMTFMEYNSEKLFEQEVSSLAEVQEKLMTPGVHWLNIDGIHDLKVIEDLASLLSLSPLLCEDILNTDQRPKYEDLEQLDAFILKMIRYDSQEEKIIVEQITLLMCDTFVITLQEDEGDVFDPVRNRIRNGKGRVRLNDNDYLAYALLDVIADNYLTVIETLGKKIDDLEYQIFHDKSPELAEQIYRLKSELNFLRKSVRPVKDLVLKLNRSEDTFFQDKNKMFLNALSEQITDASEAIELYHSLLSDQLNIYNTNMSNSLNQVMKVLTVFASIFIPLTFLAGIYGMNFQFMPELEMPYAYGVFWLVVLSVGGATVFYFKRKGWLD